MIINCKEFVAEHKRTLGQSIKLMEWGNKSLFVIQVGDNAASNSYIKGKKKDCEEVGLGFQHIKLPIEIDEESIINTIELLNIRPDAAGIIVQLPLPPHLDETRIVNAVACEKDVDGFRPDSPFTPCTPLGIMQILTDTGSNVWGKTVCVIGQGKTVGQPLIKELIKAGATVISCNSKTPRDKLFSYMQSSDVVITAAGRPNLISKANFWNKDKMKYIYPSIIIDAGINRDENGKLCGDCSKDLYEEDVHITPVPGGVGLYTRLSLINNTFHALLGAEISSHNPPD